jgi:hypothetical protein
MPRYLTILDSSLCIERNQRTRGIQRTEDSKSWDPYEDDVLFHSATCRCAEENYSGVACIFDDCIWALFVQEPQLIANAGRGSARQALYREYKLCAFTLERSTRQSGVKKLSDNSSIALTAEAGIEQTAFLRGGRGICENTPAMLSSMPITIADEGGVRLATLPNCRTLSNLYTRRAIVNRARRRISLCDSADQFRLLWSATSHEPLIPVS